MYINFWYPICTAEELTSDRPLGARVLGLSFVAFRDQQGTAHVLSDTCIHRGGSLSRGKLKEGGVACPYHGWCFAGDGRCQEIPAQRGRGKPPARAKVDSYPVQEKYGVVFAFLGDLPEEERPPLCEIEEYDQEGWRVSEVMILKPACYYERSMENGVDIVHNEFVHPLQGFPSVEVEDITVTAMPWGNKVAAPMQNPLATAGDTEMADLREGPEGVGASSLHHGPNTLVTAINLSVNNKLTQYFYEAPVDESHTRIFFINMRNCWLDPSADERVREANLGVTGEDIDILEALHPVRTPETTTKELLSAGDEAIVKYRESLKAWENLGWRIDSNALKATEGDVAYAVPCPQRRESGNWVLDPVPLIPAQSAV